MVHHPLITAVRLFLAFSIVFAARAAEVEGTLCWSMAPRQAGYGTGDCRATSGPRLTVAPTSDPRTFIWQPRSGAELLLGSVPGSTSSITLDLETGREVRLAIESSGTESWRWPLTAELRDRHTSSSWRFVVDAEATRKLKTIRVPEGDYELILTADHHQPRTMAVKVDRGLVDLGRLVLARHPVLSGRVVAAGSRDALPGSIVTIEAGEPRATTDAAGFFQMEIPDKWPTAVSVSAAGRGLRWVPVSTRVGDTDLGDIEIGLAGELQIEFWSGHPELKVDVRTRTGRERRSVKQVSVPASQETIRVGNLTPGSYQVLVSGDKPLQNYGTRVEVKEAEQTAVRIDVQPITLTLSVRLNESPVGGARVELRNSKGDWGETVSLDERGRGEYDVWQQGEFVAAVSAPDTPLFFTANRNVGASDDEWLIDFRGSSLRGLVQDEKGEPVKKALVSLESTYASGGGGRSTMATDDQGRFEVNPVRSGQHNVTVHADGYSEGATAFETADSDPPLEIKIVLVKPVVRTVRVVNARRQPIAGAAVVDTLNTYPTFSDSEGLAAIAMRKNETRTLFIVPKDGSFGIATIAADGKQDQIEVVVPPGEASIGIQTKTTEGAKLPVRIAARFNGVGLTPSVIEALAKQQGAHLRSDATGLTVLPAMPVGHYEFWPLLDPGAPVAIPNSATTNGAVQIAVQPGVNWVTLTFKKSRP